MRFAEALVPASVEWGYGQAAIYPVLLRPFREPGLVPILVHSRGVRLALALL